VSYPVRATEGSGYSSDPPVAGGSPKASGAPGSPAATPASGSTTFPHDALTGGLTHVGLTVHEAQMYHTLLRHGPSTARHAIAQSRLDRATGYRVLSRLRARGLVTASGYRPQRFTALDAGRLLDRVATTLRDELDLHRIVRDLYVSELPAPPRPSQAPSEPVRPGPTAPGRHHLLPGNEAIGGFLVDHLARSRDEAGALLRPALLPETTRLALADALRSAAGRGLKCHIVLDYHPTDLDFLSLVFRGMPEGRGSFEVRFYAPQLGQLFLFDHRTALRCLSTLGGPSHPSTALGVASEDPEFVRIQTGRFQTTWREAVPIELALRTPQGSDLGPTTTSAELRQWVDQPGRSDSRESSGGPGLPTHFRAARRS